MVYMVNKIGGDGLLLGFVGVWGVFLENCLFLFILFEILKIVK